MAISPVVVQGVSDGGGVSGEATIEAEGVGNQADLVSSSLNVVAKDHASPGQRAET